LSEIGVGLLLAAVAAVIVLWTIFVLSEREADDVNRLQEVASERWQSEAIWAGLVGVFAGVLPVIVANRYVFLGGYSHYALPASLASVMVVVGAISLISSRNVRFAIMVGLIFFAALTHYSASLRILQEEQEIADFWHQVLWRAPGIEAGTTLVVNYPSVNYAEDVDAVAGPANFLYFPKQTDQIPVVYQLVALPQMEYITKNLLAGGSRSYDYRTHIVEVNYANVLVISQPAKNACVHLMDAQWSRFSEQDTDQILLLGQYSNIQSVLTDVRGPRPAEFIFGPEPAHEQTWCYYYQQAERALQQGDWERIVQIGDRVAQLQLSPNDRIEWAPFLQAYAFQGDEKAFRATAVKMDTSPFVRREACRTLRKMQEIGYSFTAEIQSLIDVKLCRGQVEPNS
jgi:hypothetical protein